MQSNAKGQSNEQPSEAVRYAKQNRNAAMQSKITGDDYHHDSNNTDHILQRATPPDSPADTNKTKNTHIKSWIHQK